MMLRKLGHLARRFRRAEAGSAATEILLILPVVFGMMCLAVETGVATTQAALLDRAVDRTARALRYGQLADRTVAGIRTSICADMAGLRNCATRVKVQVVAIPRAMTNLPASVACTDQGSAPVPATTLVANNQNSFVLLRACLPVTAVASVLQSADGAGAVGQAGAAGFDISAETIIAVTG